MDMADGTDEERRGRLPLKIGGMNIPVHLRDLEFSFLKPKDNAEVACTIEQLHSIMETMKQINADPNGDKDAAASIQENIATVLVNRFYLMADETDHAPDNKCYICQTPCQDREWSAQCQTAGADAPPIPCFRKECGECLKSEMKKSPKNAKEAIDKRIEKSEFSCHYCMYKMGKPIEQNGPIVQEAIKVEQEAERKLLRIANAVLILYYAHQFDYCYIDRALKYLPEHRKRPAMAKYEEMRKEWLEKALSPILEAEKMENPQQEEKTDPNEGINPFTVKSTKRLLDFSKFTMSAAEIGRLAREKLEKEKEARKLRTLAEENARQERHSQSNRQYWAGIAQSNAQHRQCFAATVSQTGDKPTNTPPEKEGDSGNNGQAQQNTGAQQATGNFVQQGTQRLEIINPQNEAYLIRLVVKSSLSYSGDIDADGMIFRDWYQFLQIKCQKYKLQPQSQLQVMEELLTGTARLYYDGYMHQHPIATIEDVAEELMSYLSYQLVDAQGELLVQKARDLPCNQNDDPSAYHARIMALLTAQYAGDLSKIHKKFPEVFREKLCYTYSQAIDETYGNENHDCRDWVAQIHAKRRRNLRQLERAPPQDKVAADTSALMTKKREATTASMAIVTIDSDNEEDIFQEDTQAVTAPITCYTCHQEGHVTAQCSKAPKAKKCYKCLQTGHIATDCNKNTKDDKSASKVPYWQKPLEEKDSKPQSRDKTPEAWNKPCGKCKSGKPFKFCKCPPSTEIRARSRTRSRTRTPEKGRDNSFMKRRERSLQFRNNYKANRESIPKDQEEAKGRRDYSKDLKRDYSVNRKNDYPSKYGKGEHQSLRDIFESKKGSTQRSRSASRCFICDKTGHYRRDCPDKDKERTPKPIEEITCFFCKEKGHKSPDCPQAKAVKAATAVVINGIEYAPVLKIDAITMNQRVQEQLPQTKMCAIKMARVSHEELEKAGPILAGILRNNVQGRNAEHYNQLAEAHYTNALAFCEESMIGARKTAQDTITALRKMFSLSELAPDMTPKPIHPILVEGEVHIDAMMDSGAHLGLISHAALSKIADVKGVAYVNSKMKPLQKLKNFSGMKDYNGNPLGLTGFIKLKLKLTVKEVELLLLIHPYGDYDLLIGTEYLTMLGIQLICPETGKVFMAQPNASICCLNTEPVKMSHISLQNEIPIEESMEQEDKISMETIATLMGEQNVPLYLENVFEDEMDWELPHIERHVTDVQEMEAKIMLQTPNGNTTCATITKAEDKPPPKDDTPEEGPEVLPKPDQLKYTWSVLSDEITLTLRYKKRISSEAIMLITAITPFEVDDSMLFEPAPWLEEYGINAQLTLCRAHTNLFDIAVTNADKFPKVIPKGWIIGKLVPIESVHKEPAASSVAALQEMDPNDMDDPRNHTLEERKAKLRAICEAQIGPVATPEQKAELLDILVEFHDAFAVYPKEMGKTDKEKFDIVLNTQQEVAIKQNSRKLPFAQYKEVEKELDKQHQQGLIQDSDSPWASPIVVVRKKNGDLRVCVDYRKVNEVTQKDAYPLPRIEDVFDRIGYKPPIYIASVDQKGAYNQMECTERAKRILAFVSPQGLHQPERLPFGVTNGPAAFQRLMDTIMKGVDTNHVIWYLDDLIVVADTWEKFVQCIKDSLQRYRDNGIKMKPEKCSWLDFSTPFLGHIINKDGKTPLPSQTDKVRNWTVPENVTQLRTFLGLVSYYRKFIPNLAKNARCLYDMITNLPKVRKNDKTPIDWREQHQEAFEMLRVKLTTAPLLRFPDFTKTFYVQTDASGLGIGATLMQYFADANKPNKMDPHPLGYMSKTLNKHQKLYSPTELEGLAIIAALDHWRVYVLGHRVIVTTDHAALVSLLTKRDLPNARIQRWMLKLQEYNPEMLYVKGKINAGPDALSRAPQTVMGEPYDDSIDMNCIMAIMQKPEEVTPEIMTNLEKLIKKQNDDQFFGPIYRYLKDGISTVSKEEKNHIRQLSNDYFVCETDNLLRHHTVSARTDRPVGPVCVPTELVPILLKEHHEHPLLGGHEGPSRTFQRMIRHYYWPKMRRAITMHYKACAICGVQNASAKRIKPIPGLTNLPYAPFEQIGMDILKMPAEQPGGKGLLLVVVDHLSRYVEAHPLKDEKASTVANKLIKHIFSRFGVPNVIVSDRGTNFQSELFQELDNWLGIRHDYTLAHNPQADGTVERMNRTIISQLKKYCMGHTDWEKWLPAVLMVNRTTPHTTTGYTPFEVLFGRTANVPSNTELSAVPNQLIYPEKQGESPVDTMKRIFNTVWTETRNNLREKQLEARNSFEECKNEWNLKEGDRVWVHDPSLAGSKNRKLTPHYKGPYLVIALENPRVKIRLAADEEAETSSIHIRHVTKVEPEVPQKTLIMPARRQRKIRKLGKAAPNQKRPQDIMESMKGNAAKLKANEKIPESKQPPIPVRKTSRKQKEQSDRLRRSIAESEALRTSIAERRAEERNKRDARATQRECKQALIIRARSLSPISPNSEKLTTKSGSHSDNEDMVSSKDEAPVVSSKDEARVDETQKKGIILQRKRSARKSSVQSEKLEKKKAKLAFNEMVETINFPINKPTSWLELVKIVETKIHDRE